MEDGVANPVFEAVRTVLAVREYDDREIPEEVLHRILEAGRLSASSQNRQPWHFVLVRERAALEELGRRVRTGPYIAGAAAAVVVAVEKASRFGVSDGSRAIQSMVLTAWADGVGSNWTGFAGMREVAEQVGLPDEYDVIAVIPFGYPRRAIGRGRKNRKAAGEVISEGRYGTPYR
ncbi:MAG: nitroreductase family protein [Candidatus Dormibacteraeota bacterium]|nr:nitroreductase family protein [Candidatus Dormibacteraeota bacterium]